MSRVEMIAKTEEVVSRFGNARGCKYFDKHNLGFWETDTSI